MNFRVISGTLKPNSYHGGTAVIKFEDHLVGGHVKVIRQASQGAEGPYTQAPSVMLGIEVLVVEQSPNEPCLKSELFVDNVTNDELHISYSNVARFNYMVVGQV